MRARAESPAEAGHDNEASLGARLVLALIRAYKLVVSPHFYASCRFVPSCADYASEAVMRHGALAGGWLALKRLARCHPLFRGGLDPVPAVLTKRIVVANHRGERSACGSRERECASEASGGGAPRAFENVRAVAGAGGAAFAPSASASLAEARQDQGERRRGAPAQSK